MFDRDCRVNRSRPCRERPPNSGRHFLSPIAEPPCSRGRSSLVQECRPLHRRSRGRLRASPPAAPGRPAGDRCRPRSASAPLFFASSSLSAKGTTSSARLCRITVPGFTVLAVPYFFQAGQSSTSFASPLSMFMATAPPRLDPTTTWGWCLSNSAWAMRTASAKSSCGQRRVDDLVAVVLQVGRLHAAGDRVPAVEEEDFHGVGATLPSRHLGQYQGAGVATGRGLRLRHLVQR